MAVDVLTEVVIDRPVRWWRSTSRIRRTRLSGTPAPVMSYAMRRANQRDLDRLKSLLEYR